MNRIICILFFISGALYIGQDLIEYHRIQGTFHETMLIPLLLLGILAHFAFKPAPNVPPKPVATSSGKRYQD